MNENIEPVKTEHTYTGTFHGTGSDLFFITLVNAFLTPLTLGIYLAWGKANIYKFFWNNTEFGGSRLFFTGTGKEMFKGILIGVSLFIVLFLILQAAAPLMSVSMVLGILALLVFYVGFILLTQFAYFSARRYRFSRTIYREIRFRLEGSVKEFMVMVLKGVFLTVVTLGVYSPVLIYKRFEYIYSHLQYGHYRFRLEGNKGEFFWLCFNGYLLTLVTLGIYSFWFVAKLHRYIAGHLYLEGSRFESRVTAGKLCGLWLSNLLITLFTLGIGFSWARARSAKFYVENLVLSGPLDLEQAVQTEAQKAGAGGEGIGEALDLDMDIGF